MMWRSPHLNAKSKSAASRPNRRGEAPRSLDCSAGRRAVIGRRPARRADTATGENLKMANWSSVPAPSIEDIERLAEAAYARLPEDFRKLCEGVVIHVVAFPDDETLNEMGAESEFDLLGLFRGRGIAQSAAMAETGALPNMIWLYRRP